MSRILASSNVSDSCEQTSVMDDGGDRRPSAAADARAARLRAMRLSFGLLALSVMLSACGDDDAKVSPLANAADSSVDVGSPAKGSDSGLLADASDASDAGCMTCVGAEMPTWQLADYQPKSPGFGKTYGLEAFKGKVTVVALLASW